MLQSILHYSQDHIILHFLSYLLFPFSPCFTWNIPSFNFKYIILSHHIITIISYIPNIASPCYNLYTPSSFQSLYIIIITILSNLTYHIVYSLSLYTLNPLQHLHFPIILWIMFWIMAILYEYHNLLSYSALRSRPF